MPRPAVADAARAMAAPRVVIIGGGIAGASLAWALAVEHGIAATILEREDQCGYHATGRSAALYMPSYGPPAIRALTRASGAFYRSPPDGFASHPLLTPRGALHVGMTHDDPVFDAGAARRALAMLQTTLRELGAESRELDAAACLALCPVLRPDRLVGGLLETEALDMDVHAILQGFLRGARAAGAVLRTGTALLRAHRQDGAWRLETPGGTLAADVVVDAAGAWADEIGRASGTESIGLQPRRRSAFLFEPPPGADCRAWPTVIDADERFYFKPDAGLLLGSPANADPSTPQDVQPEDLDIAQGIWAIEQATTLRIARPRASWAGLRSFVPDGEPVAGFDRRLPGWFWLAGQGGYGIQSAPALARAAAALLLDREIPPDLRDLGLHADQLAPRGA